MSHLLLSHVKTIYVVKLLNIKQKIIVKKFIDYTVDVVRNTSIAT